jgi:hypothetical protein
MITQLDLPLLMGKPKVRAIAHVLGDHAPEAHPMRVCFLDANGPWWTVPRPGLRMQDNRSLQGHWARPRGAQP